MRIDQALGKKLLNTTSITTIVESRIYHGLRLPDELSYPCINFFSLPEILIETGILTQVDFQVSCRATGAGDCEELANAVTSEMMNLKETVTSPTTELDNIKINNAQAFKLGLLFEDDGVFHVPVTVKLSVINTT